MNKVIAIGIIILFISMSCLTNVSSKDISISDDNILEENNKIEPLDTYREIFTKITASMPEGYIVIVNRSGPGIFFRHVEIWSEKSFDISGYYIESIVPRYFRKSVNHVVAPRCLVIHENVHFPGVGEMTMAFAIGNIEWS